MTRKSIGWGIFISSSILFLVIDPMAEKGWVFFVFLAAQIIAGAIMSGDKESGDKEGD